MRSRPKTAPSSASTERQIGASSQAARDESDDLIEHWDFVKRVDCKHIMSTVFCNGDSRTSLA